jgi:hypothetical protein
MATDNELNKFSTMGIFETDSMGVINKEVRDTFRNNPDLFYSLEQAGFNPVETVVMQVVAKHGFEANSVKPVNIPPSPKSPGVVPHSAGREENITSDFSAEELSAAKELGIDVNDPAYQKYYKEDQKKYNRR